MLFRSGNDNRNSFYNYINQSVKRGIDMRLYLSKEEGIMLQQLLSGEIMKIPTLPIHLITDKAVLNRIHRVNVIHARIEDCLTKQKSGYNRKDK